MILLQKLDQAYIEFEFDSTYFMQCGIIINIFVIIFLLFHIFYIFKLILKARINESKN